MTVQLVLCNKISIHFIIIHTISFGLFLYGKRIVVSRLEFYKIEVAGFDIVRCLISLIIGSLCCKFSLSSYVVDAL